MMMKTMRNIVPGEKLFVTFVFSYELKHRPPCYIILQVRPVPNTEQFCFESITSLDVLFRFEQCFCTAF